MSGAEFVHSACWIQGFYIYTEMADRINESGYYGIPDDIDMDGLTPEGTLCSTKKKGKKFKPYFLWVLEKLDQKVFAKKYICW